MISSLDVLYLTLAIATITLTVVLVMLGSQMASILREAQRTAESVEKISGLLELLAEAVAGGVERGAERMDGVGRKLGEYLEKFVTKK